MKFGQKYFRRSSPGFLKLGLNLVLSLFTVAASQSCGDAMSLLGPDDGSVISGDNRSQLAVADIDLKVNSIQTVVEQGSRLYLDFEVTNSDRIRIRESFLVSVFITKESEFDPIEATWLETYSVDPMAAEASTHIQDHVTIPGNFSSGNWNVFVFADSAQQIEEVEENNNLMGPWPVTVIHASGRPDLTFEGMAPLNDEDNSISLQAGSDQVGIKVRIGNKGEASLYKEFYTVRFYLANYTKTEAWTIGSANNWNIPKDFALHPNHEWSLEAWPDLSDLSGIPSGWYYIYFYIDSGQSIVESNEFNNLPDAANSVIVHVKNY